MSSYADVANLPAPQTDDQLRKTAASQVDLEIGQSVAPIQGQIDITKGREDKSLGQVAGMFDAIQPTVDQAAKAVQSSYDQATFNQSQIFAQAQANLQQLRGNQAAEAQQLAQQIGGPVAMDQFTQPYDSAAQDMTFLGAGQQMHTLMYAQAGEQQAEQFAGQVFPLVRTEQMASVRNQFEDQIKQYQDQITALQSQRGAQINTRYNDLRTQELQYGIQRAQFQLSKIDAQKNYNLQVQKAKTDQANANRQYNLDKQQLAATRLKDNRDYQMALRAAGDDEKRIKILKQQTDNETAQLYGVGPDGKKTLGQKQLDETMHEALLAHGLEEKKANALIADAKARTKMETQRAKATQQAQWADIIENALHPKQGASLHETVRVNATPMDVIKGNAFVDPTSSTGYSKFLDEYVPSQVSTPISDPTKMVDYLMTVADDPSMTKARAIQLVESRMNPPAGWKYGAKWPMAGAGKTATKTTRAAGGGATDTTGLGLQRAVAGQNPLGKQYAGVTQAQWNSLPGWAKSQLSQKMPGWAVAELEKAAAASTTTKSAGGGIKFGQVSQDTWDEIVRQAKKASGGKTPTWAQGKAPKWWINTNDTSGWAGG